MESFVTQDLQKEIENDRLRMAGYGSRVVRRRRDRRARVRAVVGTTLVSAGERVLGTCRSQAATTAPLQRS